MAQPVRQLSLATRLVLGCSLVLAVLGLSSRPAATAQAAPQSGGTFTVTGTADNSTADGFLTLREALLVAKGGTGAAGLNRAATAGEQAALGGCTFSAGLITGGCGAGIADTLIFSNSLGVHPIIALTAARLEQFGAGPPQRLTVWPPPQSGSPGPPDGLKA